jgi:CRP/FNR family transcriptional regulator, cyclic AMP receptor protein
MVSPRGNSAGTEKLAVTIVRDLSALPLFHGIPEARLGQLLAAFHPAPHPAGTVLFKDGDVATHFEILAKGEVTIEEEGAARFQLRALAPLGELGALTGLPRNTTATATTAIEVLSMPVRDLLGFFDTHADLGLAFYRNLLSVVGDKVRRDRGLLSDMRANIIRTQKAMKEMRESVLASPETEMSKGLFETLDTLIEKNRRANYRVSPTATYPANVRLDSGRVVPVLEVSYGHMKLAGTAKDITTEPGFWSGVLVMPVGEIVVSGEIFREAQDGVVVKLDALVDEFRVKLDDYTTRVQMLDFVV